MSEVTKCLDCGNSTKFIIEYIDRTMTTYNEAGDVVDEYCVGYLPYDGSTTCGECKSKNLDIYEGN